MYHNNKITAINSSQIAYPVGINKDSYHLVSYYKHNIDTNNITHEHNVSKGALSTTSIFKGSAKECLDFINDIIQKEGIWIREDKAPWNYIHQISK